jgi:hypothetical protein
MSLTVGEVGKTFRVAAGFDMSSFTELTLTFTKPDLTTSVKTQTGGEVTLGAGVTDPDLGVLAANTYVEYEIETGFLDQSGDATDDNPWKVYLTYTNTTPTPDDVFIGTCTAFTVLAVCP